MRIARIFTYFIFFNFSMNVNVYCVADQIDATRDIHKPQIPICGNDKIKYNIRVLSVFGVIIAPIANINKNAPMEII